MASSNPSLPFPATPEFSSPPSFWSRESASLKQGIKTGLAGLITYVLYVMWHLPQGYWAVFTALVVAQVTVGASWKAALYRTIGSTAGAVAAIALAMILGPGAIRVGIALFVLASLFGYLTVLHPSFSAAGFTAAIVLVLGRIEGSAFQIGWLRVLYTVLGSFVAFAVGALLWPVRAREGLRIKLANILLGAGALYTAVTTAAIEGVDKELEVRKLGRQLHDLRRGVTQQMDEARSELAFSRFNHQGFQAFIEQTDQVRRRLTAMAEDSILYVHAQVQPNLLPSLPALTAATEKAFLDLAESLRLRRKEMLSGEDLEKAVRDLDTDLAKLREQRITAPFALDRMLPFWALVFNLRGEAQDLGDLLGALREVE